MELDLEAAARHEADAPCAARGALLVDEAVDPGDLREHPGAARELVARRTEDGGEVDVALPATALVSAASSAALPARECLSSTRSALVRRGRGTAALHGGTGHEVLAVRELAVADAGRSPRPSGR